MLRAVLVGSCGRPNANLKLPSPKDSNRAVLPSDVLKRFRRRDDGIPTAHSRTDISE
jgi:hypothetical protein